MYTQRGEWWLSQLMESVRILVGWSRSLVIFDRNKKLCKLLRTHAPAAYQPKGTCVKRVQSNFEDSQTKNSSLFNPPHPTFLEGPQRQTLIKARCDWKFFVCCALSFQFCTNSLLEPWTYSYCIFHGNNTPRRSTKGKRTPLWPAVSWLSLIFYFFRNLVAHPDNSLTAGCGYKRK